MVDNPLKDDYVQLADILKDFKETIPKKKWIEYTKNKSLKIIEEQDPPLADTYRKRYRFYEDGNPTQIERGSAFVGIRKRQFE